MHLVKTQFARPEPGRSMDFQEYSLARPMLTTKTFKNLSRRCWSVSLSFECMRDNCLNRSSFARSIASTLKSDAADLRGKLLCYFIDTWGPCPNQQRLFDTVLLDN